MATQIGSAFFEVTADNDPAVRAFQDTESEASGSMARIGRIVAGGAAAAAAAFVGFGAAVTGAAFKVADIAGELETTAGQLGVTTDFLQDAQFWAEQNGISMGTMERAVGRLNQRMGRAVEGNEGLAEAFAALDVSVQDSDGSLRDAETVMGEAITALQGIEDPALQAARAAEIFGQNTSRQLLPALQDGSLTLEDASKAMDEFGRITDDQIAVSAEFGESWTNIRTSIQSMLQQAAIPAMEFFTDTVFPILEAGFLPAARNIIAAFGEDGISGAFNELGVELRNTGPDILDTIRETFAGMLDFVVDHVEDLVGFLLDSRERFFDAAVRIFESLVDALPGIIPRVVQAIVSMVSTLVATLVRAAPLLATGATALIAGLLTGIVDQIPTILTAAGEIITSLLDGILAALPILLDAGVDILQAIVEGLLDTIPILIEFITGTLLPTIIQTVFELLPLVLETGVEILVALIGGIADALPMLIELIAEMVPTIVETVLGMLPLLIEAGIQIITAVVTGLVEALPTVIAVIVTQLIPGLVTAIINGIGQLLTAGRELIGGLWSGFQDVWPAIRTWIRALPGRIVEGLARLGVRLFTTATRAFLRFQAGAQDIARRVLRFVGEIPGRIFRALGDLSRLLFNAGRDIIRGLMNGINSLASSAVDSVRNVGRNIRNSVTGFFGIGSPSRMFAGFGHDLVSGLVQGIDRSARDATGAVGRLAAGVEGGFSVSPTLTPAATTAALGPRQTRETRLLEQIVAQFDRLEGMDVITLSRRTEQGDRTRARRR